MDDWLYTLRERLTPNAKERFDGYREFSGFTHITELVTLDSMMCPDVIDELRTEDWKYNVHEDFRITFFRVADYLLTRQPLDADRHQLIAALECPAATYELPRHFTLCGYDIMDSDLGNSTLTNCGPIPEAFRPSEVNELGLIDDRERAYAIRDELRCLEPNDPHLGDCEVWLLARRLPNDGS